jgi:hypothetical protein
MRYRKPQGLKRVWLTLLLAVWAPLIVAQATPAEVRQEVFAEPASVLDENGIPEGWKLVEGDILVRDSGEEGLYTTNLWTNGIIPFQWDTNLQSNTTRQNVILTAMATWENVADLRFVPRNPTTDATYLHIRDSSGDPNPANNSPVGMGFGERIVNIATWWTSWISVHELGHSLGLWHEQSRPNRDTYIQVNTANIEAGEEHNFDIHYFEHDYPPGGYDFDSIMHYAQCDFSTCTTCDDKTPTCWTITVLAPYNTIWQTAIGQRSHLSDLDSLTMSFLYPEDDWRFVDGGYGGLFENGTLWEPYKTLSRGVDETPTDGSVWIQPGTYTAGATLSKPMTLQAPLGEVSLVR